LQVLNDELEQRLLTATEDRAVLELELTSVREQLSATTTQMNIVTAKEQEVRAEKEKLFFEIETCKEEISQLTTIVFTERKEAEETKQELIKVQEENNHFKEEVVTLSNVLNETKVIAEVAQTMERETKMLLHQEKTDKNELSQTNQKLQEHLEVTGRKVEQLDVQNKELDKIIAELMRFPDLSMGHDFKLEGKNY
jgi:uncharacterized protein (DUF3084 family)